MLMEYSLIFIIRPLINSLATFDFFFSSDFFIKNINVMKATEPKSTLSNVIISMVMIKSVILSLHTIKNCTDMQSKYYN